MPRRIDRANLMLKLRILLYCAFPIIVSACAGVERFYFYRNIDASDSWQIYSGTAYENKTNSGTAFELSSRDYKILIQLLGNWAGWEVAGGAVPVIPFRSYGKYIDITYQITSINPQKKIEIDGMTLLLNGTETLLFLQRMPMRGYGTSELQHKGMFRFARPSYLPKKVSIVFGQARIDGVEVLLPPLNLSIESKKCFWAALDSAHYFNCPILEK